MLIRALWSLVVNSKLSSKNFAAILCKRNIVFTILYSFTVISIIVSLQSSLQVFGLVVLCSASESFHYLISITTFISKHFLMKFNPISTWRELDEEWGGARLLCDSEKEPINCSDTHSRSSAFQHFKRWTQNLWKQHRGELRKLWRKYKERLQRIVVAII